MDARRAHLVATWLELSRLTDATTRPGSTRLFSQPARHHLEDPNGRRGHGRSAIRRPRSSEPAGGFASCGAGSDPSRSAGRTGPRCSRRHDTHRRAGGRSDRTPREVVGHPQIFNVRPVELWRRTLLPAAREPRGASSPVTVRPDCSSGRVGACFEPKLGNGRFGFALSMVLLLSGRRRGYPGGDRACAHALSVKDGAWGCC